MDRFVGEMFRRAIDTLKDRKRKGDDKLAEILKKISKNHKPLFKTAFTSEDKRFLVHGDVWANNVMFNNQADCKLVDWQFVAASSPYLDFSAMAFINQAPEETEANLSDFYTTYYSKAKIICDLFKMPPPWTCKEEFKQLAEAQGFLTLFAWLVLSFSPCVHSPIIFDRFIYVFEQAMKFNPTVFADFLK